jgi:hypothetical protein
VKVGREESIVAAPSLASKVGFVPFRLCLRLIEAVVTGASGWRVGGFEGTADDAILTFLKMLDGRFSARRFLDAKG